MESVPVECLRCGHRHTLGRSPHRELTDSECPRCGYLGWAHASVPAGTTRRSRREQQAGLGGLRATA